MRKTLMLFFILSIISCRENDTSKDILDIKTEETKKIQNKTATKSLKQNPEPIESQEYKGDPLADGNHFILGLRMPMGMIPSKGPSDRVFRFEGTHRIEALRRYIEEQLVNISTEKNKFSPGYIMQRVIVKNNNNQDNPGFISIKIFDGSLGGAGIDIWEEQKKDPSKISNPSYVKSYKHKKLEKEIINKQTTPPSRKERVQSTFEVFNKMSKGIPLTEEDYNSPFFTDM